MHIALLTFWKYIIFCDTKQPRFQDQFTVESYKNVAIQHTQFLQGISHASKTWNIWTISSVWGGDFNLAKYFLHVIYPTVLEPKQSYAKNFRMRIS